MNEENVVCVHNRVLLGHKKEQNNSSARKWIELEIIKLSELRQTHTSKYCTFSRRRHEIRRGAIGKWQETDSRTQERVMEEWMKYII